MMFLSFCTFIVILVVDVNVIENHQYKAVTGPSRSNIFITKLRNIVKREAINKGTSAMYNEDQLYRLIDDKTNDDDTNQLTRLKEVLRQFLNKLNALDTTRYTTLLKTTISPSTSTDAQDFLFKFKKRQESDEEVKWGAWTNWSTCSVSCGKGRKIRWRHCRSKCDADTEMEEKTCQLPACAPATFFGIKF